MSSLVCQTYDQMRFCRWQHGTHKWYAIRKSLGTNVAWFLLFRL